MSYGQGKAGERLKAAVHKAVKERILAQRPDTTPDELAATLKEIDDDIESAIEDPLAAEEKAAAGQEQEVSHGEGAQDGAAHESGGHGKEKASHGKGHK
jgi:hypothetical protein